MNEVKYTCCLYCHEWYREGDAHVCPFGTLKFVSGMDNADRVKGFASFSPDYALFAALLERIAVALERMAEK